MKFSFRFIFIAVICLLALPLTARAQPASGPVAGVYENFTVGKGSGDLEGMRVVIIPAGGGYHAMVQVAHGGAGDPKPEFVPATVSGTNVQFSVGEKKYTGTISVAGLRLKDPEGETLVLKRRPCATLFR